MDEILIRLEALRIAISLNGNQYEDVYEDTFPLAELIYKFLKGELPNE